MSSSARRVHTLTLHLAPTAAQDDSAFVSAADGMTLLLEGKFDRKPNKQAGWKIHESAQGSFWCLYTPCGNFFNSSVVLGHNEFRGGPESRMRLGGGVTVGDRTIVQSAKSVVIGDGVTIGKGCLIMDRNHHGIGASTQEVIEDVVVGAGAIIGDYSVLLPGAVVPAGAVVPPLSVVAKSKPISAAAATRLISYDHEYFLRSTLANNTPITTVGARVRDCHAFFLSGPASNVLLNKQKVTFYQRPWLAPYICVASPFRVKIDTDTFVHNSTQLIATGGNVSLGAHCNVSWRTVFLTEEQRQIAAADAEECLSRGDIVIEDQVWIGAMVIVLPGTIIRRGSLVAAGSVVQGEFPPWSIIAGHPASVKKTIEQFKGGHGTGGGHD